MFTDDINHWLHALRLRDICLSYNCRDYQGHRVTKTAYRKFFGLNDLPDVYNGMMYFRWSQTAVDFFKTAKISTLIGTQSSKNYYVVIKTPPLM